MDANEIVNALKRNREKILREAIKDELIEMFKQEVNSEEAIESICVERGHDVCVNYKVKISENAINIANNVFDKIINFILKYCEEG